METLKKIISIILSWFVKPPQIAPVPQEVPQTVNIPTEPETPQIEPVTPPNSPYYVENSSRKWGDYPEDKKDLLRTFAYKSCQGVLEPQVIQYFLATLEAESGFNPYAEGKNSNGTIDAGVAQLNSYWYLKPNNMTIQDAKDDPERCITIMLTAWKNGRKTDWVTYKNGNYRLYLKEVTAYLPRIQKMV